MSAAESTDSASLLEPLGALLGKVLGQQMPTNEDEGSAHLLGVRHPVGCAAAKTEPQGSSRKGAAADPAVLFPQLLPQSIAGRAQSVQLE